MTTPTTFKARQMRPGHDTLSTMAMHYALEPKQVVQIVRQAGAPVIREDGFESPIVGVRTGGRGRPPFGWEDGEIGVDPDTTLLTRPAINAVAFAAAKSR